MDYVIKPKSTKEDKEVRALTIEEQQNLSNYLLNCTINEEKYLKEKMEDFYGIKRNVSITHSSANEYENGRTSQKANIFRRTNSEIRKARRINGFNNGKYKKIYKGIKCKNVQNRNNGNIRESAVDFL